MRKTNFLLGLLTAILASGCSKAKQETINVDSSTIVAFFHPNAKGESDTDAAEVLAYFQHHVKGASDKLKPRGVTVRAIYAPSFAPKPMST